MIQQATSVLICSVFGLVLIIVDIILVIVDLSLSNKSRDVGSALEAVSLVISLFFLIDVLLRVYVEGLVFFQNYFAIYKSAYNVNVMLTTTNNAVVFKSLMIGNDLQETHFPGTFCFSKMSFYLSGTIS